MRWIENWAEAVPLWAFCDLDSWDKHRDYFGYFKANILLKLEHFLAAVWNFFYTFLYVPLKCFSSSWKQLPNFSLLIKSESFTISNERGESQMLHISNLWKSFDRQTSVIFSRSIDRLEWAFIQTEGWPLFGDSGFQSAAVAASVDRELNCSSKSLSTPAVGIPECPLRYNLAHFNSSVLTSPALFHSCRFYFHSILVYFCPIVLINQCYH